MLRCRMVGVALALWVRFPPDWIVRLASPRAVVASVFWTSIVAPLPRVRFKVAALEMVPL
jgi:hypothetical protein